MSWNNIRFLKTFSTHKKSTWLGIRLRIEYNQHYPNCIDATKTGRCEDDFWAPEVSVLRVMVVVGDQTRTWHLQSALQSSDALSSTQLGLSSFFHRLPPPSSGRGHIDCSKGRCQSWTAVMTKLFLSKELYISYIRWEVTPWRMTDYRLSKHSVVNMI